MGITRLKDVLAAQNAEKTRENAGEFEQIQAKEQRSKTNKSKVAASKTRGAKALDSKARSSQTNLAVNTSMTDPVVRIASYGYFDTTIRELANDRHLPIEIVRYDLYRLYEIFQGEFFSIDLSEIAECEDFDKVGEYILTGIADDGRVVRR